MSGARLRRWSRGAAATLAALVALWLIGLWRFAIAIPTAVDDPNRATDAIVVLTGGRLRVESGLQLLAAGKGKMLFVSGVHRGVEVSELLRASHQPAEAVGCCIALGYSAADTLGNARETAEWMKAEGFHSLRLVTANYHMPRSLLEFARAMPEAEIVPNPVFPEILKLQPWWRSAAAANLVIGEYDKYLVTVLRPLLPAALIPQGALE